MKSRDLTYFWLIIIISTIIGLFVFDSNFNGYSDLITYLSIMIGFKISSLSILFSSPLRKKLWDANQVKPYKTELHRIKDYYKHSIVFEVVSVILIFVFPNCLKVDFWNIIHLGKQSLVLPILTGSAYCLYKTCKDLFRIFTYPTND